MAEKKRGRGRPPKKQANTPEINLPELDDASSQHTFKDSKSLVQSSAPGAKKIGKGSTTLNPSPLQVIREALEKDKTKRSPKKTARDSKKLNIFDLESDDEDPVPEIVPTRKKMAPEARRAKSSSDSRGDKRPRKSPAKKTKEAYPSTEQDTTEEEPSPKKRGRSAPTNKTTTKASPKQPRAKVAKKTSPKQPSAKSPQSGAVKKRQKSASPTKPRKAPTGRGRAKATAPSKVVEDVLTQASDEEIEEELEEVTALTLTKPGGRKRKPPVSKRQNPPAAQKPKSKRAKVMSEGDSPNLKSSPSKETDVPANEEDSKVKTGRTRKPQAPPVGGVSTRRRGGRKRNVQERQEEEEEEDEDMKIESQEMEDDRAAPEASLPDVPTTDTKEEAEGEGMEEEEASVPSNTAEQMDTETISGESEQKGDGTTRGDVKEEVKGALEELPSVVDSQGEDVEGVKYKVQTKRRKAVSERSRSKPSEDDEKTSCGGAEEEEEEKKEVVVGVAEAEAKNSLTEDVLSQEGEVSVQCRGPASTPPGPAAQDPVEEEKEASAVVGGGDKADKSNVQSVAGIAALPEVPDLPTPQPSPSKLDLTPRKDAPSLSSLTKKPHSLVKSPSWPRNANLAFGRKKGISQLSVMKDTSSSGGGGSGAKKGTVSQKEKGEKQMFFEELYYLLDNFVPAQSMSIRGFSVVTMATNCQKAEFRKKLNTYHLAPRIMACLMDAPKTTLLRLSTSLLMFMLTRDLGPLFFDRRCFVLMANILESEVKLESSLPEVDSEKTSREYIMLEKKVRYCLEQWSREHYITTSGREQADQISTELLSAGDLIVESIVSVSNPRRRQHFKNALRQLGVLDPVARRVMNLITIMERIPPSDLVSDELDLLLKRTQRGLVVLEQVILSCYDNQCYLVVFDGLALLCSLCKLLRYLLELVTAVTPLDGGSKSSDSYCNSYSAVNCLLTLMKLLTSVTHDNEMACIRLGENAGVMDLAVKCTLQVPHHLLTDDKFYVTVLGLTLLLNLTEHSPSERAVFKKPWYWCQEKEERGRSILHHIASLFLRHYRAAESVDINLPTMVEQGGQQPAQLQPVAGEGGSGGQPPLVEGVEGEKGLPVSRSSSAQSNLSLFLERGPSSMVEGEEELERQSSAPRAADTADFSLDESFEFISDEEDDEGDGYDHDKSVADLSTSLVINRDEFNQALEQAGQHLEDSMTACYCALLLGMLARHDRFYRDEVKKVMPSKSFSEMIKILENFLSFLDFAKLGSRSSTESVRAIVTFLSEDCQQVTSDVTEPSQVDLTDTS